MLIMTLVFMQCNFSESFDLFLPIQILRNTTGVVVCKRLSAPHTALAKRIDASLQFYEIMSNFLYINSTDLPNPQ